MNARISYIAGMSRSGTSWISDWLAAHPAVGVVQETYLIQHFTDLLCHQPLRGRLFTPLLAQQSIRDAYLRSTGPTSLVVDKSPSRFYYRGAPIHERILEIFPDARILCCYKDGKDYVYSQLNTPWPSRMERTVADAVSWWIESMQYLERVGNHPQIQIVRYESLLELPERSNAITEFLGLEHHCNIRPWSVPVNTRTDSYDPHRWEELQSENGAELRRMNPLLVANGYTPVP